MANTLLSTDSSAPARLPPSPPLEKITEALTFIDNLELAECLAEMPLSERQPDGPDNDVVPDLYHDCLLFHHKTLAHAPGMDCLEALVKRTFYHPKVRDTCHSIVSSCPISPMVHTTYKPYGHLAPRNVPIIPWSEVHVDCIGPWKVSLPDNNTIQFYALTCINPVTNLIEILRFHGPPTTAKMKQLFEKIGLLANPIPKRSSMTTALNSSVMTSNFHSTMPALSRQILAPIPPHPTRSLKRPTKSLAKFYEPYSLSITQLTQHRLITFSMRLSLQRCKLFIALLTPLLATTHLAPSFSSAICFLTYPLLQISLPSLTTAKHKLTPASSRLTPAGLYMTTPLAIKSTTTILTATNWMPFALVPIRSSAFTPTIPSPFNAVLPMNTFPFVILLRSAHLKIPSCGRMSTPVCHLSPSGSPLA